MSGLDRMERLAVDVALARPRCGLALVGDAVRRERLLEQVLRATGALRCPGTIDVAQAHLLVRRARAAGVPIALSSAELLDPAACTVLSHAEAVLLAASELADVDPILEPQCALVVELPHDQSALEHLWNGASRAPGTPGTDGTRPTPPAPPRGGGPHRVEGFTAVASQVVGAARSVGIVDHVLEIGAAHALLTAEYLGAAPGDCAALLERCIMVPHALVRSITSSAAQESSGAADEAPTGDDPAGPGSMPEEQDSDPGSGTDAGPGASHDSAPSPVDPRERSRADADGPPRPEDPADTAQPAKASEHSLPDAVPMPRPRRGRRSRVRSAPSGRAGPAIEGGARGRVSRLYPEPRPGTTVNVRATLLRAARRRAAHASEARVGELVPLVRPADLRWARRRQVTGHLVVIVVDASGSMGPQALRRAKAHALGLLDIAYTRRDRIGVIIVRGQEAVVGLTPTRSIARVRVALRRLPEGGGTPMASGLLLAARMASAYDPEAVEVVVMTDGRANVGLTGPLATGDATADAERAATVLRSRSAHIRVEDLGRRRRRSRAIWLATALAAPVSAWS